MAASVQELIESLEAHLARTQHELQQLREENDRLRQTISEQRLSLESSQSEPLAQNAEDPPVEAQAPRPSTALGADSSEEGVHSSVAKAQAQTSPANLGDQKSEEVAAAPTPPSPHALLKQWYERYPNAFFTGHTKPLKVGIHHDLAERERWSGKLIRRALANYVNLPRYVKSMREGAERVDLDGRPAGLVDKEASQHASERRREPVSEKPLKRENREERDKAVSRPNQTQRKSVKRAEEPHKETPSSNNAPQKHEDMKPLSMEEKIKGLLQKFEGR
ncbi:ProQ/FINO family protein [Halomonas sp. GD1P12]|uniref:ProQ/FINO family protein n=1 Tax=Halomonas sp. GD1P12 TaxID=2982691 RepID=UPI0021E4239B|nr:ProQ/FINO family protein [Halomonas sp. GD1P12]UYF98701.1 ProQ/FINO family protein [Halomonas sp. GD1P12]